MIPTSNSGGYILLIEDDPGVREGLSEIITNEGYPVVTCADGQIAMNRLSSGAELPRMIVLDFTMPHMDGWAFLAERKKVARLRHIPVLGMSASQRFLDQRAPPDDVEEFLSKPFLVEDMLRSIEKHWV
jgi:type IV pili sensor histidine kinase/response regulator